MLFSLFVTDGGDDGMANDKDRASGYETNLYLYSVSFFSKYSLFIALCRKCESIILS